MSAKHTDAELECCEEHIVHTDAVMAARSAMPAEEITTAASDFFKAFSDKTRLRILAALVSAELCVCDIASLLNMSQSAISHQLRFLKQARLVKSRKNGKTVGLVPTMGYLHEGHMSLIRKSVSLNDVTVVSVFVNPIQFGANEDLGSYPRDIERDTKICEECGADLIFNPEPEEMYGDNFYTSVNMKTLPEELCGITRPVSYTHLTLPTTPYV